MSTHTDEAACPICGYEDAQISYHDGDPFSLRCPVCQAHLTDPAEILKKFDSKNFDWNDETMPEERGLYIVRHGEICIVAEYWADEEGDYWELPKDRMGNPYQECGPPAEIKAWAELPKCCKEPKKKGKQ